MYIIMHVRIIHMCIIMECIMFIGRKEELQKLNNLYKQDTFQMVVVYGRRRVGKTALINEFCRDKRTLSFTALDQSDADNLADFNRVVCRFFDLPSALGGFSSWIDALSYVAEKASQERFVLSFDEFPYAAERNESLPSVFQVVIDKLFKNTNVFMILCGSNQGFMESNVLGRKSPLFGRRTAQIKLGDLGFRDAAEMMPELDAQEAFRFYGCFGGVPYYLQQLDTTQSLLENISRLYFDPMGFLFEEPYSLLRQEFREPASYNSILRAIAAGANRPKEIADRTKLAQTSLPRYLKALEAVGIAEKAVPFGENPETSKRGIYRLSEACYAFWFRFVMPYASDIESGLGRAVANSLSDELLADYLGHRFEALCVEWLVEQAKEGKLPIPATAVSSWWGTNPDKRAQDDIDVLAADRVSKKLILGECKYRESFDETAEIEDLMSKCLLVKGYSAAHYILFSKHEVSTATQKKVSGMKDVRLVTLEEMYGI